MTRPKHYGSNRQIRFTDELWSRLNEYQTYVKNKTGIDVTHSEIIRGLLDEALTNKGLPNESKALEEDCQ